MTKLLPFDVLKQFVDNLKNPSISPKRKLFFSLIKAFNKEVTSPEDARALLGVLFLAMQHCKNEQWIQEWYIRSSFYQELTKGIQVTQNNKSYTIYLDSICDKERIVCLQKFYEKLNQFPSDYVHIIGLLNAIQKINYPNIQYQSEVNWYGPICDAIRPILKRLTEDIDELTSRQPSFNLLKSCFDDVLKTYTLDIHLTHAKLAHLVKFVNETCDVYGEFNHNKLTNPDLVKEFSNPYKIRLGLLLFVMHQIENEHYIYAIKNPGSVFYQALQTKFNLLSSTKVDPQDAESFVAALFSHIKAMREKFKDLKENGLSFSLEANTIEMMEKELPHIHKQIGKYQAALLGTYFESENSMGKRMGANTSYLTQFIFNSAVSKGISKTATVVVPMAKHSISLSIGAAGFFVLGGPMGGLLGFCTGELVVSHLLTLALSTACISLVRPVGTAIGSGAGKIVSGMFYVGEQGLHLIIDSGVELDKENVELQQDFIQAILNLPAENFSEEKKQKIKQSLG